jgi:hypothetical protein
MSLATLLILFASAGAAREPSRPVEPPLPEAVLPHPTAESDRPLEAAPRWTPQALAEWPGPWVEEHPGPYPPLYDHRFTTW